MTPFPTPETAVWMGLGCAVGLLAGSMATWAVMRRRQARADAAAHREILRLSTLQAETAARLERMGPLESELRERGVRMDELLQRSARLEAILRQERREAQERQTWVEEARRHAPNLEVAAVAGGHHFHMETGVAGVAGQIRRFLQG